MRTDFEPKRRLCIVRCVQRFGVNDDCAVRARAFNESQSLRIVYRQALTQSGTIGVEHDDEPTGDLTVYAAEKPLDDGVDDVA